MIMFSILQTGNIIKHLNKKFQIKTQPAEGQTEQLCVVYASHINDCSSFEVSLDFFSIIYKIFNIT